MENEAIERRLRNLTDRADISDLMSRYLHSLDEGVFDEDWARAFHTEDVTAEWPIGSVHGREALLEHVRGGMALFDRTVHMCTDAVIEVDGDQATVRGNQLSTHVLADGSGSLFISAGQVSTELVRTAEGWRISATSLRVVWTQGTPPRLPTEPARKPAL
ncbi:hypothetical protein SSP24_71140 [Streptomyces spinoverrucosus]|uniref:SnoaL-like domain-containing protein n=1 Tax=Streptomyces spinoverrucosus TaxID=284043 RepID=A0A4Y3VUX3_9ACTN|nr:nuclear transport factor 2 family protein [Streptomyces spinoverrucosus]GEC09459.1 hypothetical protein SSP24_71140 [Streptomyces spinoverrucosus]GHB86482.1 hypothetical protein GCM10010397_67710 [Streptomyces spinoverrucosus]